MINTGNEPENETNNCLKQKVNWFGTGPGIIYDCERLLNFECEASLDGLRF